MDDRRRLGGQQLLLRVAEHLAEGRAHFEEAAVRGDQSAPYWRSVERGEHPGEPSTQRLKLVVVGDRRRIRRTPHRRVELLAKPLRLATSALEIRAQRAELTLCLLVAL